MKNTVIALLLGALVASQDTPQDDNTTMTSTENQTVDAEASSSSTTDGNSNPQEIDQDDGEAADSETTEMQKSGVLGTDWNGLTNVIDILTDEPLVSESGLSYGTLNVKTAWYKGTSIDSEVKMGFWWDFQPSENYAAVQNDSTMTFAFAADEVEEESSLSVFSSTVLGENGGVLHQYRYAQDIAKSLDTMSQSPIGPSETEDLADSPSFPFLTEQGLEGFYYQEEQLHVLTPNFWAPNFQKSSYDQQTGKMTIYMTQASVNGLEPGASMALGIYATFGEDEITRVLPSVEWAVEPSSIQDNSQSTQDDNASGDGDNVTPDQSNTGTGVDGNDDTEEPENPDEPNEPVASPDEKTSGLNQDNGGNALVVFTAAMLAMTFALTQ